MAPRLVALAGPRQGETFTISEEEGVIGRDSDWLLLTDASASRQHCVVKHEGQGLRIQDLDSRSGTFVNGIPVKERTLQHGDRIQVGNSLFLFLTDETESFTAQVETEMRDDDLQARSTVRARMEDVLYLQPEKLADNIN